MNKGKVAFVTPVYTDSDFESGGVKLNFILIKDYIKYVRGIYG
ncbi:MAG: hypothetical protein PHV37_00240 [Candidatus Gastranaerophilales bacterium]|nr:hypothetical protein [Candidatus Gastranaerophilales bacterium]